jgi:hypothetical protein
MIERFIEYPAQWSTLRSIIVKFQNTGYTLQKYLEPPEKKKEDSFEILNESSVSNKTLEQCLQILKENFISNMILYIQSKF